MTKIDVISGFLGAGKTTFIKKIISETLTKEKIVLIENEFGKVAIDGGFLKDSGIEITEMSQGCICCSLVGDFEKSLREVIEKFSPDRIIIEPSGVGKLSDVMKAVTDAAGSLDVILNSAVTVVDASKCRMYRKNFGEFFENQIQYAGTVVLTRTDIASEEKIAEAVEIVKELNGKAEIVTTPLSELTGEKILSVIEKRDDMLEDLRKEALAVPDGEDPEEHEHEHHHHHHHHDRGEVEEYNIGTYVYYRRPALDINKFDNFVAKHWPKNIIRAKGLCYFSDELDKCYLFEQSGVQKTVRNAGLWFATMPEDQLQEMMRRDKNLRRDWDPAYGDRMIKIVFIGQNLDRKEIARLMDECLEA